MLPQVLSLFSAMAAIIATWVVLWLAFTGIGLLVPLPGRPRPLRADDWFLTFWIGWAATLAFLQVWHLVLPVDWRAAAAVGALGLTGLLSRRDDLRGLRRLLLSERLYVALLALVVLRLANRALAAPDHIDAGLYHLGAVRWAATYAIVPGLGNLDPPLAINSSHFLCVALLDFGPWAGRASHLANGLLIVVAAAQALAALLRVARRRRAPRPADLFLAICLPAVFVQAAFDPSFYRELFIRLLSSPTPDVPVFLLQLVVAAELLRLLGMPRAGPGPSRSLLGITLLVAAGTTVKLTFAVYGALVLAVAGIAWVVRGRPRAGAAIMRTPAACALVLAIVLGPWLVRGVVLSGYPLYPAPILGLDVDWRMPRSVVVHEEGLVQGHARLSPEWEDWGWVSRWASEVWHVARAVLLLPGVLFVLAVGIALAGRLVRAGPPGRRATRWPALLPATGALVFWFFSAPSWRFAGSAFWVLGAGSLALAVCSLSAPARRAAALGCVAWAVAGSLVILCGMETIGPGPDHGFHPAHEAAFAVRATRSGLKVNIPVDNFYCWDGPLPSASYPNPALRLRRPGDLSSGFTIRPPGPATRH
jgi:hypothetical protein